MKDKRKTYNTTMMAIGWVYIVGTAINAILLPLLGHQKLFLIATAGGSLLSIIFAGTAFANLRKGKLILAPTILQIIILFWTIIGIPLGIWGIILLRKQRKELG
jgi:hypothetical protein